MKKNIIISSAVVICVLIIYGIAFYVKGLNTEHKTSNSYKEAYSDIDSSKNIDDFSSAVFNKVEIQNDYTKKNKAPNKLQSNISNIKETDVIAAINALVNEPSQSINEYDSNNKSKIEFKLLAPPKINSISTNGVDSFSYNIMYLSNSIMGAINFVSNTSPINEKLGEIYAVDIYMKYQSDMNAYRREQELKNLNTFNTEEERKQKIDSVNSYLGVTPKFEQGITFRVMHLKIAEKLNMPKTINIWNENSSDLYPCHLKENEIMSAMDSYIIKYSCIKLPNVNDYTGDLKILFD